MRLSFDESIHSGGLITGLPFTPTIRFGDRAVRLGELGFWLFEGR